MRWRERLGADYVADITLDHGELVTAETGHGVGRPNRRLQPFGNLLQKRVADRMSQCVIDVLEPVEVDGENREAFAVALQLGLGLPQSRVEPLAVRQTR